MLATLSCDTGPMEVQWTDGLSMLFIGNSITYWHDIPGIVAALADSAGIEVHEVESSTRGGWSLRSHWNFDLTRNLVSRGGWDVVVLQGYTGIGDTRDSLLKYAQLFADEASAVGARTALFMRNPGTSYREYVGEMASAYKDVSRQVGAVLLPVAEAWETLWRWEPEFNLYEDDVHPNRAGSYLSALVIYQHLTEQTLIGLPTALTVPGRRYPFELEIAPEDAALLQEAAAAVAIRN